MEESTSREKVLKRIRHALIYKTDNPYPQVDFDSPIYKEIDDSIEVNFAQEFTKAGGIFVYCEDESELVSSLAALQNECNWHNICCTDPELQFLLTRAGVAFDSGESPSGEMNVAVTGCEFLISRLGSIMVSSVNGRKINISPQTHVVVAKINQLVFDLDDAIASVQHKYHGRLPSLVTVITGPSRTADIEKTLVMGAHGPRELFLLLLDVQDDDKQP